MEEKKLEQAMFGAGCFWGIQDEFSHVKGVVNTTVGYAGGAMDNPSYKDVCTDKTGHAEVVLVEYDASEVSYEELVKKFWEIHDPTTLNRQGPDSGTQYRSIIFYFNADQEMRARASKEAVEKSGKYQNPLVTEIVSASPFYKAEEYHQEYLHKKGLHVCH